MRMAARLALMLALLIGFGSSGVGREPPEFLDKIQKADVALLERYLRVQVGLVRTACELSPEQTVELGKLNADWIAKAYKTELERHKKPIVDARLKHDSKDQMLFAVESEIDEAIRSSLIEAQRKVFDRELESRRLFRCQAIANALVAALDSQLFLSRAQCSELATEIAKWMKKSDIRPAWQFYFQTSDILPNIPKSVLGRTLTEEQMNIINTSYLFHVDGRDIVRQIAR